MEPHVLRQLRGAKDLVQDGVEATATAVAEAHQEIAHMPYAVLGRIPMVAGPACAIEQVQCTITDGVYATIHAVNRLAGAAATCLLDRIK